MAKAPIEYEGTWEEIAAHAPDFAGRRLRLTVLDTEAAAAEELPPLERRLQELASRVPPEEWARLPTDLTDRLDDYIYGDAGQ